MVQQMTMSKKGMTLELGVVTRSMITSLLKKHVGIILITCFVLGFFALQSPSVVEAAPNDTNKVNDCAVTGGTDCDIDTNAPVRGDAGTNGSASVGERLGLTKLNLTIFNIFSSLGAMVVWLGGSLLDATIGVFTVGMYEASEFFQLDETIKTMWGIIRDIFNLLFIFGLIFAGFKLILGIDDSGSKKMIGSIIVAALLINFSLYAAQIVVDFSNVMAYQINQLIQPPETTVVLGGWSVPNISTSFTQLTNLDQLGDESKQMAEAAGLGVDTIGAAVVLGLLFTIFYSVLGFVFAAGAFVLFSRFIALIFLMIFSPVMFLGFIFPNFKSYSSQWGKLLINQALVGPAFLFMLYLSLQALSGLATLTQFTITNITIYLLIVTAFLWGSLMVARSMSNWGAMQAYNAGEHLSKMAGGFVGRNTVGRFAHKWNEDMEKRGVSDKSYARRVAMSLAGNKYGGNYSVSDLKTSNEKAGQKRARYEQIYGKEGGYSKGGRREGGIIGTVQTYEQAQTDANKIKMEQAIAGASSEQLLEILGSNKPGTPTYERIAEHMSSSQFDSVMKAKAEELDDSAKEELGKKRKGYVQTAVTKLGGVGKASEAQLKVLGAGEIATNAGKLKQSQFDDIMKSKDYTETEKNNIRTKREEQLEAEFLASPSSFLTSRKDKEIAKLPADKILKTDAAAPHLTRSSLKQMIHEDTLTQADRNTIKDNVNRLGTNDTKNWFKTTEGRLF